MNKINLNLPKEISMSVRDRNPNPGDFYTSQNNPLCILSTALDKTIESTHLHESLAEAHRLLRNQTDYGSIVRNKP